jgi:hypothetical protein
MLALLALLLVTPAFAVWGWFAPATPIVGDLILAAVFALVLAYPVKIVLKHVGEAGTLWTRVVGCLSSLLIAFGNLALAWGVGNGLRHHAVAVEPADIILPMLSYGLLLMHLFDVVDFIPEDEEEKGGLTDR